MHECRTLGFHRKVSASRHSQRAVGFRFVLEMFVFGLCSGMAFADSNDLRSRLTDLATEGGFTIGGLDSIGPEAAGSGQGSLSERLNVLLQDYNYVLLQDRFGGIEKVLITSRKNAEGIPSGPRASLYTVRLDSRHYVQAAIAGPSGTAKSVTFLIDTGATTVVLPMSLIGELGFMPNDLRQSMGWGVGGPVPILVGRLRTVRVGTVAADDILVSFVADENLRGKMLLGMSFLQRFRVTIDDKRGELVLLAK